MKYEFWAEFNLYDELAQNRHEEEKNKTLIDAWVGRAGPLPPPWDQLSDAACRQSLMAQVLVSTAKIAYSTRGHTRTEQAKEYARTGALRDQEPSGLLYWYYGRGGPGQPRIDLANPQGPFQAFLSNRLQWMAEILGLAHHNQTYGTPLPDLTLFPLGAWALQFTFTLRTPYLSRDDVDFYIIDNPVRKDKVFKLPMVVPSSWKGSLRHALWQLGARHDGKEYHDDRVKRLFGETRDDETGQSGRLFFYPTFFSRIGLEIINPHDRVRRVGKNPILFECVPEKTSARFTLLYVPFDRIGNEEANPEKDIKSLSEEAAEDLTLVAQGLQAMFTLYGFGAKTSSGFGLAEDRVSEGRIQTNVLEEVQRFIGEDFKSFPHLAEDAAEKVAAKLSAGGDA